MRILLFGRGVIATIYGQAFQAAGHDIEFYVRPGRLAEYGHHTVTDLIDGRRAPLGRRTRTTFATRLRDSLEPDAGFDLVVLSVAHHRLREAATLLAPCIGTATVLVLGNVWEEPLAAVAPLPPERVVFGFPGAGGGFDADGVLHGAVLRSLVLGTSGASPDPGELLVRAAFRQAGFVVRSEQDMRGWLWLHFAMDAGMFAQAYRSGGLAAMIGDRQALREAFLMSREARPVLEARGVDLRLHRVATLPTRFPRASAILSAWATSVLPIARASLAAHTDPGGAEPRAVLQDILRTADDLGIATPRLRQSMR